MIKFKKVLFGFCGTYLFVALSLAQAQATGDNGTVQKWRPGQMVGQIYSQLDLTDDQKKQLEANKQQHRGKMQSIRQGIKADRETLKAELMKTQLDMPRINQIHEQIKSLQDQMEDERLSSVLAVRAILTTDQFLKFVNLMHRNKNGHEEHD